MMARLTVEIPEDLSRQIQRVMREGWFSSQETLVVEAVEQFIGSRSFLGDSPRMLLRFAADALNESKPATALKFIDRGLALLDANKLSDLGLYQSLVELRVQILLVSDRQDDALHALEQAKEKLPNNPSIDRWIARVRKQQSRG